VTHKLVQEELLRSFDLARGPPHSSTPWCALTERDYLLLINMHGIIEGRLMG
jgi:hypothetical protein